MHGIRRFSFATTLFALFTALWQPACLAADEAIVARIEAMEAGFPVQVLGSRLMAHKALSAFYGANGYQTVWQSAELRRQLIDSVEQASREGLNPADYHADILSGLALRPMSDFSEDLRADLDLLFSDAFLMLSSHMLVGKVNPQTVHAEWTANRRQRQMESVLRDALERSDVTGMLDSLRPADPAYRKLMIARQDLTRLLGQPWLPLASRPTIRPGDRDERLNEIRRRLSLLQEPAQEATTATDPLYYDTELESAVIRFQARHGLEPDGLVGRDTLTALNLMPVEQLRQIDATLERWRWLPESLGDTYVLVNIAGFELKMVENGEEVLRKRVIVGQPFRQTPVFSDRIRYLVFNPTWTVPRTLMIQDQLPQILRDPDYLSRLNISVYRGWGADRQKLDPLDVDWSSLNRNNFPYQLVQEPGPRNALGQIKFMFPNQYDVYLHDTPGRGQFTRAERSFSSGCIRVEQPFDLAERLLASAPDWSREKIDRLVSRAEPQTVVLPEPVPVHIQYWTSWVDNDGRLQFRNDLYNRDARLIDQLRGTADGDTRYNTPVAGSSPVKEKL
ncbi:Murein L,D-transpeptidase YcbB/YkuD [Marinobacter sp. es.048]|uniref:L,D-transpeptidase family protein n=1 Tax=Marinobacter sp. es.048 TaxID=1761795 RepID=UPI000B59142F|nr:L,D-transpeptidase family protein [Marinobacter sp. es.048]SNC66199.1 Murein L,D-transpeptidase YcbB/YkuD [Marinobacter sp. es.048]